VGLAAPIARAKASGQLDIAVSKGGGLTDTVDQVQAVNTEIDEEGASVETETNPISSVRFRHSR